jgi:hypothetical protein
LCNSEAEGACGAQSFEVNDVGGEVEMALNQALGRAGQANGWQVFAMLALPALARPYLAIYLPLC